MGKDAKDAVPALEDLLQDPIPLIETEAAKAILLIGKPSPKAVATIEKQLDGNAETLLSTLSTIAELGPAGRPLFAKVKRVVLASNNVAVMNSGFQAINAMQADLQEIALIWAKLVRKDDRFLSSHPADAIRAHPKEVLEALPRLLELLNDPDVNVRRRTTEVLEKMGPVAEEAIPALIKALDNEPFVAHGAMEALGSMGSAAKSAVPSLVRKFEAIQAKPGKSARDDEYDKRTILIALEKIGPAATDAVPKLITWLPKEPRAARVLGQIGPGAKDAVKLLEKTFASETGNVKVWSAFALVKITGKAELYVSQLADELEKSKDYYQRRTILEAFVELGPDAKGSLPTLLLILKEKNTARGPFQGDLRSEAARALIPFANEVHAAIPDLIDIVQTGDYWPRRDAAELLGAMGPAAKSAIPALEKMVAEYEQTRPIVKKILAKIQAK